MSYYKDINGGLHYLEDDSFSNLLLDGCVKISDEQAKKLQAPIPLTAEEQTAQAVEAVRIALQKAINEVAIKLGFSSGDSVIQYAGFTNKYQAIALPFANWEVSVWDEADAYKSQVLSGKKPMLSPDEAVAMMPVYAG